MNSRNFGYIVARIEILDKSSHHIDHRLNMQHIGLWRCYIWEWGRNSCYQQYNQPLDKYYCYTTQSHHNHPQCYMRHRYWYWNRMGLLGSLHSQMRQDIGPRYMFVRYTFPTHHIHHQQYIPARIDSLRTFGYRGSRDRYYMGRRYGWLSYKSHHFDYQYNWHYFHIPQLDKYYSRYKLQSRHSRYQFGMRRRYLYRFCKRSW